MLTADSGDPSNSSLKHVLAKISEIAAKSVDGGFIYRGENECFPEVSSGLYREYKELGVEDLRTEIIQQDILRDAKRFTNETDDLEILDQLQHFGYQTNLIDFTTDCLIALFFSCDGQFGEDGRVILLRKGAVQTRAPRSPASRVLAQKSLFVIPTTGVVEPEHIVTIPAPLKEPILTYLRACHDITTESIYNDLHGFIRQRKVHPSFYAEFCIAFAAHQSHKWETAIEHYTKSIEWNPLVYFNFVNRAEAYTQMGLFDRAISDCNSAIELNPNEPAAFYNRGCAYVRQDQLDLAIADCTRTIELNPAHVNAFVSRGTAHSALNHLPRAMEDYNRAIEIDPRNATAFFRRGVAFQMSGETELAMKDFNAAIDFDSDYTLAYSFRGFAYIKLSEFGLAINDCTAAIKHDPKDTISLFNRGIAELCLSHFEDSIRDLNTAKDLGYDVTKAFRDDYGDADAFEKKYNISLPADIASLLTHPEC